MEYMNIVHHHRIARYRLIIVHNRRLELAMAWCELLRSRPIPFLIPWSADISEFAGIRPLIHAPVDITVNRSTLDTAVKSLGTAVSQWRFNHMERLFSIIEPLRPSPTSGIDDHFRLQLAVCVLTCTAPASDDLGPICQLTKEFMWYPQFLDHCCNHRGSCRLRPQLVNSLDIGDFCSDAYNVIETTQGDTWSAEHLKHNDRASLTVQHILTACRVDFQEASAEYVDSLNLYVACVSCHFNKPRWQQRTMTVMSWRRAVRVP